MSEQAHNSSLLDLLPDVIVELYEIDLGEQDGIYRFHPGLIDNRELYLNNKPYFCLPVDASGFEKRGDGQLPRPTLTFANMDGIISDVIKRRGDLIGKTMVRKRIFLKFLDNANFPNSFNPFGIPDPESRFDDETYIVNRKVTENKFFVEFEIVSPLEFEDVKLPTRIMIANYCPWKYRGIGCRYGQRADYGAVNAQDGGQRIRNENITTEVAPLDLFQEGGQSLGDLGIPIADENNKLFWEKEGYNLTSITWRGDYDRTTDDYVKGDIVRIKSKINNLAKLELTETGEDLIDEPDSFYVCIKNVDQAARDPRYDLEYWVKDQCAKNVLACRFRYELYGKYSRGLPFGGQPSIEAFRFQG